MARPHMALNIAHAFIFRAAISSVTAKPSLNSIKQTSRIVRRRHNAVRSLCAPLSFRCSASHHKLQYVNRSSVGGGNRFSRRRASGNQFVAEHRNVSSASLILSARVLFTRCHCPLLRSIAHARYLPLTLRLENGWFSSNVTYGSVVG